MSKIEFFENNINNFEGKSIEVSRHLNIIGTIRATWFLAFLVFFVYFINVRQLSVAILCFFIFIIGFSYLVIVFNRLKFNQNQVKYLIRINNQEINRLNNNFDDLPTGTEYGRPEHDYAYDLDIFGEQSVYQLINRTSTVPGCELMVQRVLKPQLPVEFKSYHETLLSLSKRPELLQEYQALGMHHESNSAEFSNFQEWLNEDSEVKLIPNRILLIILPAFMLIGLVLTTLLSITYYTLLPLAIVNVLLLSRNHALTSKVVEQTYSSVKLLKTFSRHIKLLKESDFDTEFALAIQQNLHDQETDAEKEISRLSKLLDQLQTRKNLLHAFVNIPLLLDLQWMTRLNDWKTENRENLANWMQSLAEFEVLVSLAATSFINPEWSYPSFVDTDYVLDSTDLGHPLINSESSVCNDFTLNGTGKAVIITGPNMAGKSTFLRTLALNVVLAKMGAPVCATRMTLSRNMEVFTVMRTQDNLSENISSFYAELDRIKQLLSEIESGRKVLFFLDELLKGTNSADRHKGAEALVKQLIDLKVSGFVSTHDIELGELTKQMPEVSNFSFESIITEGQIHFDYKIREGVCSSFNASELMRQMGIKV